MGDRQGDSVREREGWRERGWGRDNRRNGDRKWEGVGGRERDRRMEGGRQWKTKEEEEGRREREGVGGEGEGTGWEGGEEGGYGRWKRLGGREGVGVERETVEDKGGGRRRRKK